MWNPLAHTKHTQYHPNHRHQGLSAKVMGMFKKKETIEADPNKSGPWWEVRW